MKKNFLYLLLFSAVLLVISCEPEGGGDKPEAPVDKEPEPPVAEDIIEIPDEHFKHALVDTNSIDTNGDNEGDSDIDLNNDGEIQRSEAELAEGLILHFNYSELGRYLDLSGIENFINLKYLSITGTGGIMFEGPPSELISYDLTDLKKLEYFELSNIATNYFEVLDLSGLDRLTEVKLITNRPNDYEGDFRIPVNYIEVKLQGAGALTKLNMHNSFLKVDLCLVPALKTLDMSYLEGGEPEVFDFHCLTDLEWLDISDNHIDNLILKNSSVLNTLIARDIGYGEDGFANYPYLEYICIDDIQEEFEQIATLRDENTVVVTDCSF
jgi:hypothetical protein